MPTRNEALSSTLNDLIEINNDRIEGYEKAVSQTDDPELKGLFIDMVARSHRFKQELSDELRPLGEEPTTGTRNTGKAFRVWMDIKAALTGKDRHAILESCERGEDAALDAYAGALGKALTGAVRVLVDRQNHQLLQDHSKIKMMRDAVVAKV